MNKVLVTGAGGQLGKKIFDNKSVLSNVEIIFLDVNELNIGAKESVDIWFKNNPVDVIINCAAYTAVDNAEEDKGNANRINNIAVGFLASKAKENNARFIHVSTDYVFDGKANIPYKEADDTNPISVYGITKLDGELTAKKENPESLIIRTSWLYSEYGKNFLKTIIHFAKEKESLSIVNDQYGTPTYAGDLAFHILSIVKQYLETDKWKPGVYHYSNLGACSWYDFAVYFLGLKGIETPVYPVSSDQFVTKAHRPSYSLLDKQKIIDTYDLRIPYWQESCANMLKYL